MSTKKSLLETKDVAGNIIKLEDRVAYPAVGYGGYRAKVHTGTVKRITDCCIWILPDKQFKDDRSGKQTPVTNGEPRTILNEHPRYGWDKYVYNKNFKIIGYKKSAMYDWYLRRADRCVKL